jgi:hypothetical protein
MDLNVGIPEIPWKEITSLKKWDYQPKKPVEWMVLMLLFSTPFRRKHAISA